ncbi:hypothetical protein ACN28S_03200 [Cystobacter fuscus]
MTRSTLIKKAWLALVLVGWASVALTALPREAEAEPLYFALEVRREGRLVAQPKLLGETGRTVRAERRKPGAQQPDYRLVLTPTAEGKAFHLELDRPCRSSRATRSCRCCTARSAGCSSAAGRATWKCRCSS